MRKNWFFWMVLLVVSFGCDDKSKKKVDPAGKHGGPCLEGDLCDEGLSCVNTRCWLPEELGLQGNPCKLDGTCEEDLVCDAANLCQEPGEVGTLGNPCRADGTCDRYLVCDEDICRTDADEDGYPVERDCDDQDATVYPGVIVDCSSACNHGVKVCNPDGTWSHCTADAACDCTTPGQMREVDCGNCGWAYQRCGTDFQWEFPMACQDEGECRMGTEQSRVCGNCGTQERLCGPQCTWFAWSECTGEGVCEAGQAVDWTNEGCPDGEVRRASCSSQCQWVEEQPCTGGCLIAPRTGGVNGQGQPDFKDEVCIPGGAFLMGNDEGHHFEYPQHRVVMTSFLIDKYEVTVARYRECVDAGSCTVPGDPSWTLYFETDKEDYPISGITWDQALAFCAWDGGRTLPTEAQWEKAARGPEPRTVMYPWGDATPTCAIANYVDYDCMERVLHPVSSYPDGISYYGLYQMAGNVMEFTLGTFYWYENYLGVVDPYHMEDLAEKWIIRGTNYASALNLILTIRSQAFKDWASKGLGFRCARSGY